jgi:hypothetical protein
MNPQIGHQHRCCARHGHESSSSRAPCWRINLLIHFLDAEYGAGNQAHV